MPLTQTPSEITWDELMSAAERCGARADLVAILYRSSDTIRHTTDPQTLAVAAVPIFQGIQRFLSTLPPTPTTLAPDASTTPLSELRDLALLIAHQANQLIASG